MSSDNIEKFNEITGKLFALLYGNFPVPLEVSPLSIGIAETPKPEYDPETSSYKGGGEASEEEKLFGHTLSWLVETGYFSARRRIGLDTYQGIVLTAKGLEVLKAVPSVLNSGESFGEQLQKAAKAGMVEKVKGLTNEVLSKGVGLVVQTVSSSLAT